MHPCWRLQKYTAADFCFTTRGDMLYAIGLAWPTSGEAVITSLGLTTGSQRVQGVALLGSDAQPRFEQRADALHA